MNNDDEFRFAARGKGMEMLMFLGHIGQAYSLEFEQFRMVGNPKDFNVAAWGTAIRKAAVAKEELEAAYPDVKTDTGLMALLVPIGPAAETSALYQAAAHFIATARRQSGAGYFDNLNDDEIQAEFRGWLEAEGAK